MGRVIVKQPDGLWAVFSTIVDDFIYEDMPDLEGYIKKRRKEVADDAEKDIRELQAKIERDGFYYMTYNDCMETIKAVHGSNAEKNDDIVY